jgi:hypothetical protein
VLSEKFTNNDLYIWLEKELGKVFRQYVKTLLEVAQMAEKAYHFEIEGDSTKPSEFMAGDYWETFYKGLLAPERILLDLRRMEKAYLENDEHKMEISRPIVLIDDLSNVQVSSGYLAITEVLENSNGVVDCTFVIQKNYFSSDFQRISSRFIRDVKLQIIPTAQTSALPFMCVNAEITLNESLDSFLGVWATSVALAEPDKYVFSFVDNKYSPFEGVSLDDTTTWHLRLTGLDCINIENAKVVLFVSYTAKKEGTE